MKWTLLGGAAATFLLATSAHGGSLSVSREITVDRTPATVWKLLGEFNALDVWLPPVQSSASTGVPTRPGAIRVLDLGNNARVTEKLLAYDGAKRSYSYAFVKSPLPVKEYVATIELREAPDGRTLVRWHSTFDAAGVPDDQAKQAILGIYEAGLARVALIFGK
jgi:mxaD protein